LTVPSDVVNEALDAIGLSEMAIGDLEEGSDAAKPALRAYMPTLRELLRAAYWNFARKQGPLTLLQDQTGQSNEAGTGTSAMGSWTYEYAFPTDAAAARFLVAAPDNTQTQPPIMTGLATVPSGYANVPQRFLLTQDTPGSLIGGSTGNDPDWQGSAEQGPNQRTVILTNVKDASLIYTSIVVYPDEWDVLFRQAFVSAIASKLCMPLIQDKKVALAMRAQQIALAKDALTQARVTNGNEGFPHVQDHVPDWLRVRTGGVSWRWGFLDWGNAGMGGVLGYPWSPIAWTDGSVY
jgi:hypothetical protein